MVSRQAAFALLAAVLLVFDVTGGAAQSSDPEVWKPLGGYISKARASSLSIAQDANDGGRPYLAYSEYSPLDKRWRAYVKTLQNGKWVQLGDLKSAPAVDPQKISLALHPTRKGQPWLAFLDGKLGDKLVVVAWNSKAKKWEYVARNDPLPAFTVYQIAFSKTGTPFVAYEEKLQQLRVIELRKTGKFSFAGDTIQVTKDATTDVSLAISPTGVPYVAYRDLSSDLLIGKVLKLQGSKWVPVGKPFSKFEAYGISLAFSNTGVPHVAFTDEDSEEYLTVKAFKGNSWVPVGPLGFAGYRSERNSIVFSPDNTPHVAYQCPIGSGDGVTKPCVRFYAADTKEWIPEGDAGFSNGELNFSDKVVLAITKDQEHYVAYSEQAAGGKAVVKRLTF